MHLTTDAKQQDMKQRRASRGCSATVLSYVYFGEAERERKPPGVSFIKNYIKNVYFKKEEILNEKQKK